MCPNAIWAITTNLGAHHPEITKKCLLQLDSLAELPTLVSKHNAS